jgi:hypothetical protein
MHRSTLTVALAGIPALVVLAACGEQRGPTEVRTPTNPSVALSREDHGPEHAGAIVAHDACDPATFDAALQQSDACVKQGHVTFNQFVAQLQSTGIAREWRFTPDQLVGRFGVDILGNNVGGEVHTFTPVRQFNGGIVPLLNQLSDTPVVATECTELEGDDFVPSGGKYLIESEQLAAVADGSGIARVQCCIHPWMRAEVRLRG